MAPSQVSSPLFMYFISLFSIFEFSFVNKKSDKDLLAVDSIQWADGFLLVYSILDKASFDYIQRFRRHVLEIRCTIPCVLVANKADMVHLRQVPTHEGINSYMISSLPSAKTAHSFTHDPNNCSYGKNDLAKLISGCFAICSVHVQP